jgi:small neutral amino acid transporter SnatA (MarC family)
MIMVARFIPRANMCHGGSVGRDPATHGAAQQGRESVVSLALAVFSGLLFCFAGPISRRLGVSGMGVVTRVMGMILAAIAMGMLADGLRGMLPGLAG